MRKWKRERETVRKLGEKDSEKEEERERESKKEEERERESGRKRVREIYRIWLFLF